jgi:predicted transposase YdaD
VALTLAQNTGQSLLHTGKSNILWTVAQKYIVEGKTRGKAKGIQIGEAGGEARGKTKGEARLLNMMLKNGSSIEEISRITLLSVTRIK